MKFDIAGIRFDKAQRYLQRGEQKRQLEPKVYGLLTCLIEANGQLVTRNQLLDDVWNGRVVGEGAINRTVSLLRGHFSAFTPEAVIETVPTQGYRLQVRADLITEDNKKDKAQAITTASTSQQTSTKDTEIRPARLATFSALFICLVSLITFIFYNNQSEPRQLKLTKSPLIGLKGWEYQISASNDGDTLLFHHLKQDQQQDVLLYQTAQHQQQVILENALATISPDGKQVFFVQIQDNNSNSTESSGNGTPCQMGIYDIASSIKRHTGKCEHLPTEIKWSKDNYLYFNQRYSKSHPYQVFRRHLTTGQLQQITNPKSDNNTRGDFKFSIQADSQYLAILRYIDENTTEVLFYQGLTLQHKLSVAKGLKHLAWHPNNQDLIVTDGKVVYQLAKVDGQLTELTQLNNHINSIAVFKRGGQSHLLVSDAVLQSEIVKFDFESQDNTVFQSSGRAELLPRITADRVVFMSTRYQGHHWWQINNTASSSDEAELIDVTLPFSLGFTRYQLSPHSDHLLFAKSGAVFELDLQRKRLEQVFDASTQAYVVNYLAGPQRNILYSSNKSGQWQLWRYNRQNKRHTQLTSTGGYHGVMWQNKLLYSKFASDGLWLKYRDKERLLIADFDRINWLNWHIHGDNLYFYRAASGIWRYDLRENTESLVMPTSGQFVHQYTVSPDQQSLYWVRRLPMSGDIYQYSFIEKKGK